MINPVFAAAACLSMVATLFAPWWMGPLFWLCAWQYWEMAND
jgi:hypothetical protein